MNEIIIKEEISVETLIYEIRGKQVMLDSDLAKLYKCVNGTKDVNRAVKRNIERFPENFYFQLTDQEHEDLQFQSGTTNKMSRTLPYVFTEQGVAMLSSILHTEVAEITSVRIMRSFVKMRRYISQSLINNNIERKLLDHDNRINLLEETFNNFKDNNNHVFFEGQMYDAYSLLIGILNKGKNKIIIIDNYAGKELLDILKIINKNIIISKNINNETIKKYNNQYSNV